MNHPPRIVSELDFYAEAVRLMQTAEIPFLVGGAYALRHYTGIIRDTKDFDLFVRPTDLQPALQQFRNAGFRAEIAFSHWLAKVHYGENFIDFIFRAGNGLCEVDDLWFRGEQCGELMGRAVRMVPPEEMIWQKAYIMERERFDGADVAHLIRFLGDQMDWRHLVNRFAGDWRVLFSHLILYGFIYPGERDRIPRWVMDDFRERLRHESEAEPARTERPICNGTLISRAQYLPDTERWDYIDPRPLRGKMTAEEVERWTNAIGKERAS